jgi:hypothetical protein
MLTSTTDDTAILDSGCTSNFLSATALCTSKQAAHILLSVNITNGKSIQSSHTCDLLLTDLPPQARKAHVLSGLVHNSLIYVRQLCDNGCEVTFNKDTVSVMHNGKCVMLGTRDPQSGLWRVNLKNAKTAIQSTCNHAHDKSNQKELINYLHAACVSPVKSTWIAAIKNGNFTSWPGLTERAVEKYLLKSSETVKLHLSQKRINARSTNIKEETKRVTTVRDLDYGIQTNCIYAAMIDAGQIYTDQTGRFPVIFSKGNTYIMVLYEYYGNAILAEPIKNRTAPE